MNRRIDNTGLRSDTRPADVRVHLPLLDRLLEDESGRQGDEPLDAAEMQAVLLDAVRRDLEALLNARRPWRSLPPGCQALQRSIYAYGLTDFAAGAFNDPQRRQRLRTEIADAIARFEPRLSRVVVDPDADRQDGTLCLRIRGLVHAEPLPEPIAFDTLVHPATATVEVK